MSNKSSTNDDLNSLMTKIEDKMAYLVINRTKSDRNENKTSVLGSKVVTKLESPQRISHGKRLLKFDSNVIVSDKCVTQKYIQQKMSKGSHQINTMTNNLPEHFHEENNYKTGCTNFSKKVSLISPLTKRQSLSGYRKYYQEENVSDEEGKIEEMIESHDNMEKMRYYLELFESRMENCDHSNIAAFYPALSDVCQKFDNASIAVKEVAGRLMSITINRWHPIEDMFVIVDFFTECQHRIDPIIYDELFTATWMKVVKQYITKEWDVTNSDSLIDLIDGWRPQIPETCDEDLLKFVSEVIVGKLRYWDPLKDEMSPHIWVKPWQRLLENKFNNLMQVIIQKLCKIFRTWTPRDKIQAIILKEWTDCISYGELDRIFVHFIQEKVVKFVNELSTDIDRTDYLLLNLTFIWSSIVSSTLLEEILLKHFIPRMITTLRSLLMAKIDLRIVGKWYKNWMNKFPEEMKESPRIKKEIQTMLQMMVRTSKGQTVDRHETISAGLRHVTENIQNNRDRVELVANDSGIVFHPKAGANNMHQNRQIYHLGESHMVYFDHRTIYVRAESSWEPITLRNLEARVLRHRDSVTPIVN